MTYPTFHHTVINSPQWARWVAQCEKDLAWDVHESMEIGALSPGHFQAFLAFVGKVEGEGEAG